MTRWLFWAESLLSGGLPFALLLSFGLYLSFKTRFFQVRCFPACLRYAFCGAPSEEKGEGLTPFCSACTALSATVGTGNIAGVAGAISLGGAGAVFWMWVSALAGMCVKAAEIGLSMRYREKQKDGFFGGPMFVIKNGIGKRALPAAYAFAAVGVFSAVTVGAETQTNAAAMALQGGKAQTLLLGLAFTVFAFAVLSGSNKLIGAVNAVAVPLMALAYILLCGAVIFLGHSRLPMALAAIIQGAFCPKAVTGGAVGSMLSAVAVGASRGVFSNEAGLGTSGMAHAAGNGEDNRRCLYGIFEVFVDTVLICTLTALTILCGGVKIEYGKIATSELVREALSSAFGTNAGRLLAMMMCLFSISSVIGWGFYGKICLRFLAGENSSRFFTALYPLFCITGAVFRADTVWRLAGLSTGLMLSINVSAMIFLRDSAVKELKVRRECCDKGKNRVFENAVGKP